MRYHAHFLTVCRYVARNALQAERTARAEDWRWDSLRRWQQPVEPVPTLRSSWPIPRAPHWLARVNEPLTDRELTDLLSSARQPVRRFRLDRNHRAAPRACSHHERARPSAGPLQRRVRQQRFPASLISSAEETTTVICAPVPSPNWNASIVFGLHDPLLDEVGGFVVEGAEAGGEVQVVHRLFGVEQAAG